MKRQTTEELPFALAERRAIYYRAVVLKRAVFVVGHDELWQPPSLMDFYGDCPSVSLLEPSEYRVPETPGFMEFARPFEDFNLRLQNGAAAVKSIGAALKSAGLSDDDLDLWQANADPVFRTQESEVSSVADRLLSIDGNEYLGEYTQGYSETEWVEVKRRLAVAGGLFARTATAVSRILQTVGPDGILDRLTVDRASNSASLDGTIYTPLTEHETTLLHYLRLGVGEWVGSPDFARAEGLTQFKVAPSRKSLAERLPTLARIIDHKRGLGGRVVLPLPPT